MFKKNKNLKIRVDFKKLNVATKKDSYPLPFTDEVINTIAKHEVYTFLDGFFRYHHISITSKDWYKIAFAIDWGAFVCVVMHAFWGKKWTTHLSKGNHQSFS